MGVHSHILGCPVCGSACPDTGVSLYMRMHSNLLGDPWVPQYLGMHSQILGPPVYGNAFPYIWASQYIGMHSHILAPLYSIAQQRRLRPRQRARGLKTTLKQTTDKRSENPCPPTGAPSMWKCIPTIWESIPTIWESIPVYWGTQCVEMHYHYTGTHSRLLGHPVYGNAFP
jgi:hypothetical protein